jgi:hypothetical protein
MGEFILCLIVFNVGVVAGYLVRVAVTNSTGYDGTIKITKIEDRTIFSLELEDDPEQLEHETKVIFRVKASDMDSSQ